MALERIRVGSRAWRGDCRGQTMVEFAFAILFLLVFILGIIELIMYVYTYNALANSAKEGVRYAIVHGVNNNSPSGPSCTTSCTDINAVVRNYASLSFHDASMVSVCTDYNPPVNCGGGSTGANGADCNDSPCAVQVSVSYPYQPFFFSWPTVNVTGTATGRIMY